MKLMNLYPFEYKAFEAYLNEMASKGKYLKDLRGWMLFFEKSEEHYHYRVVINREDFALITQGMEYVTGNKDIQVFRSKKQHTIKEEEVIEDIKKLTQKNHRQYTLSVLIYGLIVIGVLLFGCKLDMFLLLNMIANRKLHLLLLYWCLLMLVLAKLESPLRKFKKDLLLVNDQENLERRGLAIFILCFVAIMMLYYLPILILPVFVYIVVTFVMKDKTYGVLLALFLAGIAFYGSNAYFKAQALKREQVVMYDETFEVVSVYESIWLKTNQYHQEDVELLKLELKESKMQKMIENILHSYYQNNDFEKNTYMMKKSETEYVLIQTQNQDKWLEKVK